MKVMDDQKTVTGLIAQTDAHGRFAFTGLAFGNISLSPEKQESEYFSTLSEAPSALTRRSRYDISFSGAIQDACGRGIFWLDSAQGYDFCG